MLERSSTRYCQETQNIEDVHKEGLDFVDSRVVVVFVLSFTSAELSNQFGDTENSISRHSLKRMSALLYVYDRPFQIKRVQIYQSFEQLHLGSKN